MQGHSTSDLSTLLTADQSAYPGQKYVGAYKGLGITQVVIGALSVVTGVGSIAITNINHNGYYYYEIGEGIWCGAILIVAGVLSIISSGRPTVCLISLSLAAAIIATAIGLALFGIELSTVLRILQYNYNYNSWLVELIIHGVMGLLGFIAMIIGIVMVVYCSKAVCCGRAVSAPSAQTQEITYDYRIPGSTATIPQTQDYNHAQALPTYNEVYPVVTVVSSVAVGQESCADNETLA
uniref:Uncharacterized LOC100186170 n=1 Tax=Ciona intestinalis TaxID=7719 RepID=F6TF16_CIOIN|nr:uncharacterized protein LOC100186170 [Ciona intestinalis]|eukprot:XP_002131630.1 uncharacterized protein LOC100186170 [Ciona intestinalis]